MEDKKRLEQKFPNYKSLEHDKMYLGLSFLVLLILQWIHSASYAFNADKSRGQRACQHSDSDGKSRKTHILQFVTDLQSPITSCDSARPPAPTDLFIDTGSAAQSPNPDSVQRGIQED